MCPQVYPFRNNANTQTHIVTKFEYLNILNIQNVTAITAWWVFLYFTIEGFLAADNPEMPLRHFSTLPELPQ